MQPFTAWVRKPGQAFSQALSEHPKKNTIDLTLALQQHKHYVEALEQVGGKVEYLPTQDLLADATFVEDTAVILEDNVLLCPMKELSRQGEVPSSAMALKNYRDCITLNPPATLDGGDVMNTPDVIFVGLSKRTNATAVQALARHTTKKIIPVTVTQGLHLKSATTYLGNNRIIIDTTRLDTSNLKHFDWIEVSSNDSYAANCLALGNTVLLPAGFPHIREKIQSHGFKTIELEMSEFEKADGGITCLSLILP